MTNDCYQNIPFGVHSISSFPILHQDLGLLRLECEELLSGVELLLENLHLGLGLILDIGAFLAPLSRILRERLLQMI